MKLLYGLEYAYAYVEQEFFFLGNWVLTPNDNRHWSEYV